MSFSISDPSTRTSVSVSLISMDFVHCIESLGHMERRASRPASMPLAQAGGRDAPRSTGGHDILSSLSNPSMSRPTITPRVSIDELVRNLRAFPASAFDQTQDIRSLLAKMPVDEASLATYLPWDRQHYTRNLIDKTDLYELIAICWQVGQRSSVHNHRGQNCWMAAPAAKILRENFRGGF